jgi:circadian clock protein KaiA
LGSSLAIGLLYASDALSQSLKQYLGEDFSEISEVEKARQYALTQFNSEPDFWGFIQQNTSQQNTSPIDCLIFQENSALQPLLDQLQAQAIFFPAIVLKSALQPASCLLPNAEPTEPAQAETDPSKFIYHSALMELSITQLSQIRLAIDQAVSWFIDLPPFKQPDASLSASETPLKSHQTIAAQQQRLSEKLKERLNYLGIYYKRNPRNFLRYLTRPQKEELLKQLKADYRRIILLYFTDTADLNQQLDNFVNGAFFADIPVAQIVEIHMDLMDEFAKQLKLEGRSDEVLQDYRLTLIDAIAHLCEMYRRSIPREA